MYLSRGRSQYIRWITIRPSNCFISSSSTGRIFGTNQERSAMGDDLEGKKNLRPTIFEDHILPLHNRDASQVEMRRNETKIS